MTRGARGRSLAERFATAARVLKGSHQRLAQSSEGLPRAAEWLLDNEYVIQTALVQMAEDLAEGFWRTPPRTPGGEERVALLARRAREEQTGPVDLKGLRWFLDTAQEETALTIGEIWAFPALLRLEVLEDLARTSAEIGNETSAGAEPVADRIASGVLGLRALAAADWKDFFESVSLVERELRRDPAGAYKHMDFATRDRYRQAVEELARGSGKAEMEVAREVVRRGEAVAAGRARHVGHHLIDAGRAALERDLGYRPPSRAWADRWVRRHPGLTYLGGIAAMTAAALVPPIAMADWAGTAGAWMLVVAALAVVPAITLAVSVVNSLLTLSLAPRVLPKMDFERDLPDEARTLVAIPSLLSSAAEVRSLLAGLEIRHLANPGKNLGFALLTDFADAPRQEMPGDTELLRLAAEGIRDLAARYGGGEEEPPRFCLLHRERRWNAVEKIWMGWERKRGKLSELNQLLAGREDTSYVTGSEELRRFGPVAFVLVLDADTHLPRGVAARLAATLAHPLNRAEWTADGRVLAGYSVLQPRIEITPDSSGRTRYSRLFAGGSGLDLYSHAVSDVYQDLFGMGIFAGKGIYDPVAFEAGLAGRIPENALLSHDLFEGLHGRAALVSDVVMFEDFPPNLLAAMPRQHRWMRGDWQLLPWLLPRVPAADGRRLPNRLPWIGRWMMLDNLRRSLFLPSLLLLFVAVWTVLPGSAWVWTAGLVGALALPISLGGLDAAWRLARGAPWKPILANAPWSFRGNAARSAVMLVFLPCEAWMALDAILRTLARLLITRRHFLEWTTAAHTALRLGEQPSAGRFWRALAAGPACAVAVGALVAFTAPERLAAALPLLVAWAAAPQLAAWMSRPAATPPVLSGAERARLRRLARLTWHFYESFVGPEDHWLPPDNFQEDPGGFIAHRTSPTNIGMLLLSTLSAWDLGYLGTDGLAARLRNTFETLARLGGMRGHLWNWYDTLTLAPLEPRYVSTVDSGNLAGALVAVARGCEEAAAGLLLPRPALRAGLADTVAVLAEVVATTGEEGRRIAADLGRLRERIDRGSEEEWSALLPELEASWLLRTEDRIVALVERSRPPLDAAVVAELRTWAERLRRQVALLRRTLGMTPEEAGILRYDLLDLAAEAEARALAMDFSFLLDPKRKLFLIGFDATSGTPDPSYYDLLASEARLASLFALAKGDAPPSHWLHLGRPFTRAGGAVTLLSRNGTMFEYLMPTLLAATPEGTLLAQSCRAAVARQQEFAREQGIPWGISESCSAETDAHRVYRYRAFGVPGLGLKRDLGDRLVVAPYASLLALPFDPAAVSRNLDRLLELNALGRYGLFEAVDFGPTETGAQRVPDLVRCYMAHHQGMILTAVDNFLNDGPLVRRFHADPRIATVEIFLHEKIPRYLPLRELPARKEALEGALPPRRPEVAVAAWQVTAGHGMPRQAHVLGNGRYSVLITNFGGGSSRWQGRVLVRGEADLALEPRGTWIWIEDLDTGEVWRAAGGLRGQREVWFAPHLAELTCRYADLMVRVKIVVAPDEDLEARLVHVSNLSGQPRRLALTSYGEVALVPSSEDRRHTAFNKLFVESGWLPEEGALLFQRRPRSAEEETVVLVHTAVPAPDDPTDVAWETDRARFLGRTGGYRHPAALGSGNLGSPGPEQGSLDPIFALRRRLDLGPREEGEIAFLTAAGDTRRVALDALQRRRALPQVHALLEQARLHAGPELREAGVTGDGARHLQGLLSALPHARPELRPPQSALADNRLGQAGLWPNGISGDRPILLVRARRTEDVQLLREVLAAHAYWRQRSIAIDLVVLDSGAIFEQPLRDTLDREIARSGGAEWRDRPGGGIFVVRAGLLSLEDRTLLEAVAGAVLDAERGGVAAQLRNLSGVGRSGLPPFVPIPSIPLLPETTLPLDRPADLLFDNGLGGFTPDSREYVIHLEPGRTTPAPWVNVVANPRFGFLTSESGGGFTWAGNSSERRLTPWRNDPVADTPGESLYLRDEETGEIWSTTRLPAGEGEVCQARHAVGATRFLQQSHGLAQELRLSVAPADPVKIASLRLTNLWRRPRRITATWFAEWVLGTTRQATAPHIVSEYDIATGALLARCPFPDGGDRTAFLASDRPTYRVTADRAEFLGIPANRVRPVALDSVGLANAVGAGLDPCAALQIYLDLAPGETVETVFLLGQGEDREAALALVERFRDSATVVEARRASDGFWEDLLGAVQVKTPEPGIDLFANRWLLGQTLSCRIWGRSALYQSSGAFGFRDQLQDVLALLGPAPGIAREHILEAARHQFEEGDVMHWWHPPDGRGVRTRCSDDLLWLPYVTARYVAATGDRSILGETVPFRGGPQLLPEQAERCDLYPLLPGGESLEEHCRRALRKGNTAGRHGLPLIGTCDWNDGFNRVGAAGWGESVWLGWFLYAVLQEWAVLCEPGEAAHLRRRAETLQKAIEATAWDGDWYLRAWYDDGTPLGAAGSREAEIDLIAQAWAVLSDAADPTRAARAMESAWQRLVRPAEGLTLLLKPPFDRAPGNPGYVKAYPPGVRENGGQYSHAAAWGAWAFAQLGDGARAVEILRTILPVDRTATPAGVEHYRVEPYVVPADVYGVAPYTGRGGWTWYTGTAAWTYRLILEAILGLRREAGALLIDPCLPPDWPGYTATIREGSAVYRVRVDNLAGTGRGVRAIWLDGERLDEARVPLVDDGGEHEVLAELGAAIEEEPTLTGQTAAVSPPSGALPSRS